MGNHDKILRPRFLALAIVLALFAVATSGAVRAEDAAKRGLFNDLTTDDTRTAAKTIMFAHEKK
ncbi:hypothetical protein [Antarcticimicrobium luteum]|uniref:hypothetical protein n=1 Tax=Antarcticimicrobium luteum TaxID=2547397 RepID=UPI00197F465D|nr:hypothetical protein [Antarcticimicrobium luteum]